MEEIFSSRSVYEVDRESISLYFDVGQSSHFIEKFNNIGIKYIDYFSFGFNVVYDKNDIEHMVLLGEIFYHEKTDLEQVFHLIVELDECFKTNF